MQAVILAGGLGTRLGSLAKEIPKSMICIKGAPFLEYQLDFLKKGGIDDVILCTGHLGIQIEEYFGDGSKFGVHIRYSHENKKLLGTAGALKKAEYLLEDIFFTIYGDSYLAVDYASVMSFFTKHDKLAMMTVYQNHDRYEKSNTAIEGNTVKQYNKGGGEGMMVYIDYGANIFRKQAIKLIPQDQPYSLENLFQRLIAQNELLAFEIKERYYQIGSPEGLAIFEKYLSRRGLKL